MSFRFKSLERSIEDFGKNYPSYWGCAIAGEVGEACNLIKKFERDGLDIKGALGEELADIFIYTVLIARVFNINLEEEIFQKLKIIKFRREPENYSKWVKELLREKEEQDKK